MRRDERGAVTAEAAVVLPLLAVFSVGLAWLVSLGVAQVRVQDAAREAARVIARGESPAAGTSAAQKVAPRGATVTVHSGGDTVDVGVTAAVRGPGGFFSFLPEVDVHADSVAALEGAR
jgi:Flp pilus assembly protein TadG